MLPFDLHKRYLMLLAIMIFITKVWSGLCKSTTYQFLNALRSFGATIDSRVQGLETAVFTLN